MRLWCCVGLVVATQSSTVLGSKNQGSNTRVLSSKNQGSNTRVLSSKNQGSNTRVLSSKNQGSNTRVLSSKNQGSSPFKLRLKRKYPYGIKIGYINGNINYKSTYSINNKNRNMNIMYKLSNKVVITKNEIFKYNKDEDIEYILDKIANENLMLLSISLIMFGIFIIKLSLYKNEE